MAFILVIITGVCGCNNEKIEKQKGNGAVENRNDFVITEYKSDTHKVITNSNTNIVARYSTLESYERMAMLGYLFDCTGQALIIKGKKTGVSESFYKEDGFIVNSLGDKEHDITAFTLTQVEVEEIYDGALIRKDENTVKKGDVITIVETHYLKKDENGNEAVVIPYESQYIPMDEDNSKYYMNEYLYPQVIAKYGN